MSAHRTAGLLHRARHPGRAFTLLELLIAMGVIAILVTILLPALVHARQQARDANCKNNLTQIWRCMTLYVGSPERTPLFPNHFPAMRISNVLYKERRVSGLGYAIPRYLDDYKSTLYCPNDPVRNPEWEHGWMNWHTEDGEVQCSYGYRERQGLVSDPTAEFTLAIVDKNPQKVLVAEYYEPFAGPVPRVHHKNHINLLRCNGTVEQVSQTAGYVSFGPTDADFVAALAALDK
jgi:prepilin-type N-terminal cleavage/methylation domain-containing protein